ncbi:YceD family protein [Acuticoccus sp.]|uniref:YceD family protein n=1 Tax=Acuticoccus sp. TaxID=1904378 RepID=UPI003B522511
MTARLRRPVSVRRLTGEEVHRIEASEPERAALVEALDLVALDALTADVALRPWRGQGVRVTGTVRGAVVQSCVVTLEPVPGTVEEEFDVRLHPDAAVAVSVEVDPDAPDPPEKLTGHEVDVGAICLEHFVLGLDPYPRAPGVEFEADESDGAEAKEPSPFAVLARLKNGGNRPRGGE